MLNHHHKVLLIIACCLTLIACHKPPVLDETLVLEILNNSNKASGYAISLVTNNPHALGTNARGWTCVDKQKIIDAGLVICKKSGRSGVYLKFTDEGKKLIVDKPWGDSTLRNARVIAVSQQVEKINSIEMLDKSHATVSYTSSYNEHTPFASDTLKKLIPLNTAKAGTANLSLVDKEWMLQ
ncbi:MAG: hypothetical protein COB62_02270 [Piscirickettsiaceae bacterium]|nr:MAG: hypothetical protein COB62_02270 [Piscirickettsiaceae bacterium]